MERGVWRKLSSSKKPLLAMMVDTTAHQMGIVFESASGINLPLLVESTIAMVPDFCNNGSKWRFNLRNENAHSFICPSVDLK
jgi:hypothetical protein